MKLAKTTLALAALLLIAGAAQATHLVEIEGFADCDGWQFDGTIWFGSAVSEVTISYVVDLTQDGSVVTSASGSFPVSTDAPWQNVTFGEAGTWDQDLCGEYVVSGTVTMTYPGFEESLTFTDDLLCECPPDDGCFRTPGFWKNHDWPVESLMIAGVEVSRDDLMEILWTPVRGDATVILTKHLIAAKLNVISGNDDSIQGVIDDADAYLIDHPVFSRPSGDAKTEGLALKDDLVAYNEQGCDGDDDDLDKAAAVENTTWSNLRDLYR